MIICSDKCLRLLYRDEGIFVLNSNGIPGIVRQCNKLFMACVFYLNSKFIYKISRIMKDWRLFYE